MDSCWKTEFAIIVKIFRTSGLYFTGVTKHRTGRTGPKYKYLTLNKQQK